MSSTHFLLTLAWMMIKMNLVMAVALVAAALVVLPATEARPRQLGGEKGAGLSLQQGSKASAFSFQQILAYSLISAAKSPGKNLEDIWSDCSKGPTLMVLTVCYLFPFRQT